jgi:DNA-binding NarL/FixJ family response regulator
MMPQPILVLIADEHPVVREGLQAILERDIQISIVGVANNFTEMQYLLAIMPPHVVILDVDGMGGIPLPHVARIQRENPTVAIIVFSSSVDLAPELLMAGVSAYVLKQEPSAQLLTAVHAARAGQRFLSPSVDEYVSRTGRCPQQHLTSKELSVLKLLAQGAGTVVIAKKLGIDPRSVQNYITTLRRKIGCEERTQLANWYRRIYITADSEVRSS